MKNIQLKIWKENDRVIGVHIPSQHPNGDPIRLWINKGYITSRDGDTCTVSERTLKKAIEEALPKATYTFREQPHIYGKFKTYTEARDKDQTIQLPIGWEDERDIRIDLTFRYKPDQTKGGSRKPIFQGKGAIRKRDKYTCHIAESLIKASINNEISGRKGKHLPIWIGLTNGKNLTPEANPTIGKWYEEKLHQIRQLTGENNITSFGTRKPYQSKA